MRSRVGTPLDVPKKVSLNMGLIDKYGGTLYHIYQNGLGFIKINQGDFTTPIRNYSSSLAIIRQPQTAVIIIELLLPHRNVGFDGV
ncbi:hypothetical protein [Moraxella lacunata]|uniref:hypothetical protein n=1 Tax=Moraxella lacunata TaxID=477 RepID=UPI003EDFE250